MNQIQFKELRLKGNIYLALCYSLMLVMALFTICRLGFYVFNIRFFSGLTATGFFTILLGGLRFDLTAVLDVNILFILMMILPFQFRFNRYYQTTAKWIFYIMNATALALNVIDFIYFKFTLRRTTADIFQQFENEKNLSGLFIRFLLDYWYAFAFWLALIFLMVWLFKKIKITGPLIQRKTTFYISSVLAMPIVVLLFIGGVRGGFRESTRPITLNDAGQYVKDPKEVSLVLNTPFAIIRTANATDIKKVSYYKSDEELNKIYSPLHHTSDSAAFRKDNVVIIILESFSKEFFGAFNKEKENGTYKGYTPFLDSLIQHSRTFEYSFANGRKSIDGIPSVVASIPSLGVPYILTPYSGNRINSLGSLLRREGYHTSFFHGAPNGSMGFDSFLNIAGFEYYYGKTEYNNDDDFDGWWGIWDEKFFSFWSDKLTQFPQPFFSGVFSVSSHHPFIIPNEYKNKFKEEREPILKCIRYTDYSLKKFFEKSSKMPWFKNTLFVITADHTSSNILFDETRTAWGYYSVPIIFYKPDNSLAGKDNTMAQQIDIMPTVLDYLNYKKDYVAFGRNALRTSEESFTFNYKDNVYQLFQDNYLLTYDGEKSIGLFDFKKDKMITANLIHEQSDIAKRMERKVKAIIQQYNNRLVDNKMVVAD